VRACLDLTPGVTIPSGVIVAATPHPVRNRELMKTLRTHLRRPPAPPTPALLAKLGALALRSDPALGLTGRHATSQVLPRAGFEFAFPTLDSALSDLLGGCAPR
jgi:NAD dependent epimerase/dehydratase family enzyme